MSIAIGYMPGAFGEGSDNPNYLRELVAKPATDTATTPSGSATASSARSSAWKP